MSYQDHLVSQVQADRPSAFLNGRRSEMNDVSSICADIEYDGFAFAPGGSADLRRFDDRGRMHDAFERGLGVDTNPGLRKRAYGRVSVASDGALSALPYVPFNQDVSYNADDGGQERDFGEISAELLIGPTLNFLISRTYEVARNLFPDVGEASDAIGEVHLISYQPVGREVSFASPAWLHRDDERLVGITLFSVSANLGGGDTILSPGGRHFDAAFDMRASLDTVFVTHRGLHAVCPMFSTDGNPATRNIILTMFD